MANIEFSDESSKHGKRVSRLGAHKCRTLGMLSFLNNEIFTHKLTANQLRRYRSCHNHLLFRHYPTFKKTKLHEAKHCDIHLLCPMCAIRRAARAVMKYEEKTLELLARNHRLRLYYVVLTVKNTERLDIGFDYLERSMKLLLKRRREAISFLKGKKQLAYAENTTLAGVTAGAYSFEVKRGKNSGLWHPHVNLLLLSEKSISPLDLSEEWFGITNDSYVVYCNEAPDVKQSFVEIFKYALKFSEMEFMDTYHAWEILQKRRLCGSFGEFRGLQVEKENDLDVPDEFIELFYRFNGTKYGLDDKNRL